MQIGFMQPVYKEYLDYFTDLRLDSVEQLRALAAEDLHFRDPFNDVRGVDSVIRIFRHMFKVVRNPRFSFTQCVESSGCILVRWDFLFETRLLSGGPQHRVDGMSLIRADSSGKIIEHLDFWDAYSQILCRLRGCGWIFRLFGRIGRA